MFAIVRTTELDALNQVLVKQLKNRYGDENINKKFVLGVDRSKMKFYDVEQTAQQSLVDTGQEDEDAGAGAGYNGRNFERKFDGDKAKFDKWKI